MHRRPYWPGKTMRDRWAHTDVAAQARGHTGNHRLHRRWEQFDDRKKNAKIANLAVACELAGWCWSLAVMDT